MIPIDIQSVHHFYTVGLAEMMNQVVSHWGLQSGSSQCGFHYTLNAGVSKSQ